MFLTLFKLYKWYQIAQRITFVIYWLKLARSKPLASIFATLCHTAKFKFILGIGYLLLRIMYFRRTLCMKYYHPRLQSNFLLKKRWGRDWRITGSMQSITAKTWSFPRRISSVNLTNSVKVSCESGHIYWRNFQWQHLFFRAVYQL